MARIRLLFQHCLNQRAEPLKAAPEIGKSGRDPDTCACLQFDHRNRLPRTTRTSAGSTQLSTLTNARPGSSMWIEPEGVKTGEASRSANTLSDSPVSVTGKSSVRDSPEAQPTPLRCSNRHWKTWLALTPFSLATRAIDAPGTSVASTIRRFSSAVRCTRFVRPPPPAPTSIESLTRRSSATQTPMSIRPDPDAYICCVALDAPLLGPVSGLVTECL